MDFRELSYVCAIEKYKTISGAAEHLYISQPSLSIFLQKLETELNVKLFERINKQLYPTYAGKRFLEYAENILLMNQRLRDEMDNIQEDKSGYLSVGSTFTRTRYVLPELLTAFQSMYPNFRIEIYEGTHNEVFHLLDNRTIDFAFYTIAEAEEAYTTYHLSNEETLLCTSVENPCISLAEEREGFSYPWIDLKKLEHETFLLASPHWRVGRTARRLLEEADIHPKTIDFSIVETAVAAAGCGLGVTFCSDIMAKRGSFTKTPAYFSVGNEPKTMEFILAHRKDFPLTKAYQDFIRIAQEMIR